MRHGFVVGIGRDARVRSCFGVFLGASKRGSIRRLLAFNRPERLYPLRPVLRRFDLLIDFPGGAVWLRPRTG